MIRRLLLVALSLAACGDQQGDQQPDGGSRWAGSIDTLPNGALHVQNPRGGVWDSTTAWTLDEEWRIGGMDGTGPEIFGQLRDLAIDELGRVYVLDNQARQIRIFDVDGSFVRGVGREGEGPGEFRNPNGMEWDPRGRLWVADPGNARYAVFDTSGAFIAHYARPILSYGFIWDGAFDDSGRLYEQASRPRGTGDREAVIVRLDTAATPIDTFAMPPSPEPLIYGIPFPGRTDAWQMATAVPFTPMRHSLVDRSGQLWFGDGDGYEMIQQTLEGDTLRIIEREYDPVPVTPAERSEALDRDFIRQIRERGGEVDPDLIPTQKPAFSRFIIDPHGYLWVSATPPQEGISTLDVFDPSGRYLGRLRLEAPIADPIAPAIRGESMYTVFRDDLDVPYIVRWRIAGR
jgi:sugar lactone lactonase YvrE